MVNSEQNRIRRSEMLRLFACINVCVSEKLRKGERNFCACFFNINMI